MKQNLKLVGKTMRYEGEGLKRKEILVTTLKDKEVKCKKCGENQRAHASKHCAECTLQHKQNKINAGRLQEKINKQLLNK